MKKKPKKQNYRKVDMPCISVRDGVPPDILLKQQKIFRNVYVTSEKTLLPRISRELLKWAAKRCWISGYEAQELKLATQDFDYGTKIGEAVIVDLNNIPLTVRQFCYQFVQLAEAIRRECVALEFALKIVRESWEYQTLLKLKTESEITAQDKYQEEIKSLKARLEEENEEDEEED